MASFKDKSEREWKIQLDAPTILKVREEVDPKFMLGDDSEEENTCTRLGDDQVLLCLVLYVLCADQCEAARIGQASFMKDVIGDGDTIQAAGEALETAIVNFIQPRKRKWVKTVVEKTRAMEDLAIAKGLAKLDDPALMAKWEASIDAQMDAALDGLTTLPKSATSSADLSASTPPA